uniref:Protein kinase n=1 Tax=Arachis duranensis TaxID=130453 RepID=N1NFX5_ARADU|nr:protein kinase [Arachis duranensis]
MMRFSQGISTDTRDQDSHFKNLKDRNFLGKLIWDFAFACVASPCTCSSGKIDGKEFKNITLDHKKALLLAESNGVGAELLNNEPQSVHSSFRFSFRSQVELESFNMSSSSAAAAKAALLMVNLECESLKWRTMEPLEKSISPVPNTLIRFNYHEIVHATRNFSKGRVLGRGALSCVFRGKVGILRTTVAIKRLDKEDKECAKAFCRELMIASSLHNTNIVPLLGFCIDSEEGLFLVYKFVSGGSLEHHLHGSGRKKSRGSPLPWSVRFKVAIGIAKAIAYLHYGTERCVVHRDIKPSNILLSSKKIPKLCDFGLATWTVAPSVPFLCKAAKGTFGYLAPEYFQHGKVSDKTDVYAFGVVLLELITGRKPIEAKRTQGEENLVSWAKALLQKGKLAIEKLVDPQLHYSSSRFSSQIARMIEAAAACITFEESRRPGIYEILAILKGEQELVLSRRRKSGYYTQLQQNNSDLKSHLALAMLGVSEFDDDDDYLSCR